MGKGKQTMEKLLLSSLVLSLTSEDSSYRDEDIEFAESILENDQIDLDLATLP